MNESKRKRQEILSSAFTLTDMEIFIFPELFYPLILTNIMSPEIWKWREDPWFKDIEKRNFLSRVNRIKQYIIDNYAFNLDLETWGLTTKEREIGRFSEFFDIELLKKSNALFGYEGDSYYFDLDIRKHFGLEKYDTNVIPYWKTETVEAMNAFRFKDGFTTGAGECVSLSALYGAALFVVGGIPLENIFMIATPLHSQNFIDEMDGVLTNNRRIVTHNMWFNGTSLSKKARRALENEKVTIVSHITGHIHALYKEASIDRTAYQRFCKSITEFLNTRLTADIFLNFLRAHTVYRKKFQYRVSSNGRDRYIPVEKIFEYEHSSRYNLNTESRKRLIGEMDGDEFSLSPFSERHVLNDLEDIIANKFIEDRESLISLLNSIKYDVTGMEADNLVMELYSFISTTPVLPDVDREFKPVKYPNIDIDITREQLLEEIISTSPESEMSMLSLYVYRQMDLIDWVPFIKAAVERNNVSFMDLSALKTSDLFQRIKSLDNISIYEGLRLAMPDEVWNFGRGDGIEKAILMASVLVHINPENSIQIDINCPEVVLETGGICYSFNTEKELPRRIIIDNGKYSVTTL